MNANNERNGKHKLAPIPPPPNGHEIHRRRAAAITPENVATVAESCALGLSLSEACEAAGGIDQSLYQTATSPTGPNPATRDRHTKSVLQTRLAWLRAIAARERGWQALAWLLERVDPRYGRPAAQVSPRTAARLLDSLRGVGAKRTSGRVVDVETVSEPRQLPSSPSETLGGNGK